jgi:enoyl-CoA hydratase/carnithine racemase
VIRINPQSFRYEEANSIATITLNRPARLNALTFDVYTELNQSFQSLAQTSDIKAIIITGEGKAFCSGGDVEDIIGKLLDRDAAQLLAFTRLTCTLVKNIRACPKPVIAAINGIAAGAGAVIAIAADLRIAAADASFRFLFTKIGLAGADMGAAYLLPRIVGVGRATELLMLGDAIGADEASRIGLVNRVVPAADLMGTALELADRLARGPSFSLGITKTMLHQELDTDFTTALEAEAQAQALCMQTRNFHEGYDAFKGKRPPNFD